MYNPSGDILMDNIWSNDVICGSTEFIEYFPNTKQLKTIGTMFYSLKINKWQYLRQNNTIDTIEIYSTPDHLTISDITINTSHIEKKLASIKTHTTGYIQCQKINATLDEMLSSSFLYKKDILEYETNKTSVKKLNKLIIKGGSKKIAKHSKSLLIKKKIKNAVSNSEDDTNVSKSTESNRNTNNIGETDLHLIAIPEIKEDGQLFLYLTVDGSQDKITEIVNGNELVKIKYLTKDDKKFIINYKLDEPININSLTNIYEISKNGVPCVYYDGAINVLNDPHGNGKMFNNGILSKEGIFEKGNIILGKIYSTINNDIYVSYEGTFKNNVPDGEGKFYDYKQFLIYEGQITNGKREGQGISYWETTGARNWDGLWQNDKKHGKGTMFDDNGELICNCRYDNDNLVEIE
jgi:hypothetical protein